MTKRLFVGAMCGGMLLADLPAQQVPDAGQARAQAQAQADDTALQHLLEWPVLGTPFYQVMLQHWDDEGGWGKLDAAWKDAQAKEPRYILLRGLLAERLGDLRRAGELYVEAGEGQWARYHRARHLALMGDTERAKAQLLELAQTADRQEVLRQTLSALGEITLLRQGPEAAEKLYQELWDRRPDYGSRSILLEPLLSLHAVKGTGRAWLEKLRPAGYSDANPNPNPNPNPGAAGATATPPASSAAAEALALWRGGMMMLDPAPVRDGARLPRFQSASRMEFSLEPTALPGMVETAKLCAAASPPEDGLLARLLVLALEKHGEAGLREVTLAAKSRLVVHPTLLAPALGSGVDVSAGVLAFFEKEVFNAGTHPRWTALSLWVRAKQGASPESLREEAERLYLTAELGSWQPLVGDAPEGITEEVDAPFLYAPPQTWGTVPLLEVPSSAVIWNLRGAPLVEAVRTRLQMGVPAALQQASAPREDHLPTLMERVFNQFPQMPRIGPGDPALHFFDKAPAFSTGGELRAWLWQGRSLLGLSAERLKQQDPPAEEWAFSIMVRGSTPDLVAVTGDDALLGKLPSRVLCLLLHALTSDRSWRTLSAPDTRAPAVGRAQRVVRLLVQRHPDWIGLALQHGVAMPAGLKLTVGQQTEALATLPFVDSMLDVRRDAAALQLEFWKTRHADWAEEPRLAMAATEAAKTLGLTLLPHALWGLEWQPSLDRELRMVNQRLSPKLPPDAPRSSSMQGAVLAEGYGRGLFHPQMDREPELRGFAERFPAVGDYLLAWGFMPRASVLDYRRTRGRYVPLHVARSSLSMLEKSTTMRARLTLVLAEVGPGFRVQNAKSMQALQALRAVQDTRAARLGKIVDQLKGTEGPAGVVAALMQGRNETAVATATPAAAPAPGVPATPPAPAPTPTPAPAPPHNELARALEEALKAPALIAKLKRDRMDMSWNDLLPRNLRAMAVYEHLRFEVKPEPAFALKARLMAVLARTLGRPDVEVIEAEKIDLQVNAGMPEPWLWRAVRQERADEKRAAVESFLEALKRFDFRDPPSLDGMFGRHYEWLARVKEAGRMGQFATALEEALRKTVPDTAQVVAADLCLAVFQPHEVDDPGVKERLVQVLVPHQQHLLRARFQRWMETLAALQKQGGEGNRALAARLAPALLHSWWPAGMREAVNAGMAFPHNSDTEVVLHIWGDKKKTGWVTKDAPIVALFTFALEGGSAAAFLQECERLALKHPEDEHLVSVALLAMALHGPLAEAKLQLAAGLDPQKRLRVAWRLAELAPEGNLPLAWLGSTFYEGLKARMNAVRPDEFAGFVEAEAFFPWVEKTATAVQVAELLPILTKDFGGPLNQGWLNKWSRLVALAMKSGDDAAIEKVLEVVEARFLSLLERDDEFMRNPLSFELAVVSLAGVAAEHGDPRTHRFARLALDIATGWWRRHTDLAHMPARALQQLAEALLVVGDEAALDRLDALLGEMGHLEEPSQLSTLRAQLQAARQVLRGEALPYVTVRVEPPAAEGGELRVHWSLALAAAAGEEPLAGGAWVYENNGTDRSSALGVSPGVMRRLSGLYDLEISAGDSQKQFHPVTTVSAIASTGSLVVPRLPEVGWVRGILRRPQTGDFKVGAPFPCSLRQPILDSGRAPQQRVVWSESWTNLYGTPISEAAAVEPGYDYLVTLDLDTVEPGETGRYASTCNIVALNERMEPNGMATQRVESVIGSRGWAVMSTSFTPRRGRPAPFLQLYRATAMEFPHYLVMTTQSPEGAKRARVQVRRFTAADEMGPGFKSLHQVEWVTKVGFEVKGWHVSENAPRAVLGGVGKLATYDTSAVPWRLLVRYESAELTGTEWPLFFRPGEVCLYQPTPQDGSLPRARRLVLADPTSISNAPGAVLPFRPMMADLPPAEDALIFAVTTLDGGAARTRVAWLDADLKLQETSFDRPAEGTDAPLHLVWWGKEGRFTIAQGGLLFDLQRDAAGLRHERTVPGLASLQTVPEGATPGRVLLSARWSLKNPRLLLRRDPLGGAVGGAYQLPFQNASGPLWLQDDKQGVFLFTRAHELVRVLPLERR